MPALPRVGLLKSQAGNAMGSQDNIVIVPFSTRSIPPSSRDNHEQVDVIYARRIDADSTTARRQRDYRHVARPPPPEPGRPGRL
jgi:hypothetical protein